MVCKKTVKRNEEQLPLVSVVITTYRREGSYIKEAIGSALAQTYRNLEVIVVDDNGRDRTYSSEVERLCAAYKGVTCIHNERNMGAQYSRNVGIMASSGEYIAFLDDDDIWSPEKIEVQMALFDDPSVGMVYCDGYSFEHEDRLNLGIFREASLFDRPISYELELFNDYIGSTSQAIVRRSCFAAVGLFDLDMPARQDYEMWLRITRRYKVIGSPQKLLYYRVHPGERISTNWKKCYESYRLVLEKHRKGYAGNRYAKAKLILRLFATARTMGRSLLSAGCLLRALFTSPRCVIDVVARNLKHQSFSDFYNEARLAKLFPRSIRLAKTGSPSEIISK